EIPGTRQHLIDGVIQGEMEMSTGLDPNSYIHSQHLLAYAYHPRARTALQLGLGPGLLCKELSLSGIEVSAVELDPRVFDVARRYFAFPKRIPVFVQDARDYLHHSTKTYDLIFLDTFAGEATPWHLMTLEAMTDIQSRLNPGGRLIINAPA